MMAGRSPSRLLGACIGHLWGGPENDGFHLAVQGVSWLILPRNASQSFFRYSGIEVEFDTQ